MHRSWQSKCAERERLKRVAQKRKEARHARGLRPRGPPKKLPESSARKPPRGQPKEVPESAAPKRPRGRPVDPSSKRQRRLALQLEATREWEAAKAEAAERKRRLLEMAPAEREARAVRPQGEARDRARAAALCVATYVIAPRDYATCRPRSGKRYPHLHHPRLTPFPLASATLSTLTPPPILG